MTIASVNKGNLENVRKALQSNPHFAIAEDSYGNSLLTFAAKKVRYKSLSFSLKKELG